MGVGDFVCSLSGFESFGFGGVIEVTLIFFIILFSSLCSSYGYINVQELIFCLLLKIVELIDQLGFVGGG